MSNANEKKSNTPMLIIVAVLVIAILGGWYLFSSAKPGVPANTNRNANAANTVKTSTIPPNAPPGAQPPNMAGSQNALVTLEEFADFSCGSCALAHHPLNEIKSMYGSRIRFIFRNYPLNIPSHEHSYEAAVAAEAAGMQGKFWDMQNLLFVNQKAWAVSPTYKQTWKDYATKIGLDVSKWENDMLGIGAKGRVDADMARGKAIGVNSTPTLYINGVPIKFDEMGVDSLKTLIDAELQKVAAPKEAPAANAGNQNK